jgi:hypothetical protein
MTKVKRFGKFLVNSITLKSNYSGFSLDHINLSPFEIRVFYLSAYLIKKMKRMAINLEKILATLYSQGLVREWGCSIEHSAMMKMFYTIQ